MRNNNIKPEQGKYNEGITIHTAPEWALNCLMGFPFDEFQSIKVRSADPDPERITVPEGE